MIGNIQKHNIYIEELLAYNLSMGKVKCLIYQALFSLSIKYSFRQRLFIN
jgi:hypothetical protein